MKPEVEVLCPACGTRIDVPYILLGTVTSCPSCGKRVVARVSTGTTYPSTGYQITFADFQQLVTNKAYKASAGDLLFEWYGYRIVGSGDSSSVLSREGENVDLIKLHRQIQGDSVKQSVLYRVAMALWR